MPAPSRPPSFDDSVPIAPPSLTYPPALAPFVRRAPVPVLVRSCLEWMVEHADLDALFAHTAQEQYTRELTLDCLVDLMLDVACGLHPSAHAALRARR